jgi:hypothetical protein
VKWTRTLYPAAALIGAATAVKYNAAPGVLAIAIARVVHGLRSASPRALVGPVLLDGLRLGLACLFTFVVLLPALPFAASRYVEGFRYESAHMYEGQPLVDLGQYPYLWIPMRFLQQEWALGALLIAALLLVPLLRRERPVLVLAFPVVALVLLVGFWSYTSPHYLLWTFPYLATIAAVALWKIPGAPGRAPALQIAIVAACVLPNMISSLNRSFRGLVRPHNVVAAERWVESTIPAGALVDNDWYSVPTIWDSTRQKQFRELAASRQGIAPRRLEVVEAKPVYRGSLGYIIDAPSVDSLMRRNPDWVLTGEATTPITAEPYRGYRSQELRDLHTRLHRYYDALANGGRYRLERDFSSGAGLWIRLYRRVPE